MGNLVPWRPGFGGEIDSPWYPGEIYCGPMDDIVVGVQLAYGSDKGKVVTERVPQLSENPTVQTALAMLGDCGAVIESLLAAET